MADEFTYTTNLRLNKAPLKETFNPGSISVTQTGVGRFSAVLSIGTAEEDVTLTDITTEGLCILHNLDSTNYVEWGKKDGSGNMQAIGKLKPSDIPAVFRFNNGATLRMQANAASCDVLVTVYED